MSERTYRTREFAELTGVTVRTLHHYDRIGLLSPGRTSAGYRVYRTRDLERLEQIVALRFVGAPLGAIKKALGGGDIAAALRGQRRALEEKRRSIDRAIDAVKAAEASGGGEAGLRKIIEVMSMDQKTDWMLSYFSDDARAKVESGRRQWTPELQAKAEQDWTDLFRDVEAALGEDPAGPVARALAARWTALVEQFTKGDWEVGKGVADLWRDSANWPSEGRERMAKFGNPAVWEFIRRASAAG